MEAEKTENAMGRFFPGKAFASVSPFIRLIDTRVFAHNPSQITPSDFKTAMEDYKAGMPQDPRKHGIPGCVFCSVCMPKNIQIMLFMSLKPSTWGRRPIP